MRVVVLYSGGKDSHYALIKTLESGHQVVCLITVVSRNVESYMFHTSNIRWSLLHGEALGIHQMTIEVSGEKELEVAEVITALKRGDCEFDAIVSGTVASMYQKKRIDQIAGELGVTHIAPLWSYNQEKLLREEVRQMKFVITAAMAMGLGARHLGIVVTPEVAEELISLSRKYGFSPVGEGGEFETYVVESPLFAIEISGESRWHTAGWGYYEIRDAKILKRRAERYPSPGSSVRQSGGLQKL